VLGRDAGTALFVTALGLKLLEIKSPRDIYLINYLAFIVAGSQFLYQQSILMAIYILFVCCVLLATLISINSQNPQTLTSLKTAAVIIAQALPIAIVIFILFPRIDAPRWMLFEDTHQAKSGLSDSMEPGSISRLGMSYELAFRVKFQGDIPPPRLRYWRGPVFSYTNGKRWTQSNSRFFDKFMDKTQFSGKAYHYTLLLEPQNHNWVYALDMPAQYSNPLSRNNRYQLVTRNAPEERAEYQVTSYPQYNTGYITKTEYRDNLQLPDSPSDKITALVKKLKGFDEPPEVYIEQLLNHFKTEKFYYTLMPPLMEDNPIETFLFETHYGFCSHYASAFVYLMRVANIPARGVAGYQGGELNKVGEFLEVRQANAHAWAEVWLEDKGWVRFDPTTAIAPERVEQDVNIALQIASGAVNFTPVTFSIDNMSWLKRGQHLWSSMDYSWQRWVINYNNANQSDFFESLGILDIKTVFYWLLICISSISAILAWFILRNNHPQTDPAVLLYQSFCKKLDKLQIKTGEGARSFADRIKKTYPEQAQDVDDITGLFIKIRYQPNSDFEDLKCLKDLVRHFKI
jgi:transglutaminase-like putative cysteine protease